METSPADSANPSRVAEAKAYHEKKNRRQVKGKETLIAMGKKVMKRTVMPNGNTYQVYVGTTAECDEKKIAYTKG